MAAVAGEVLRRESRVQRFDAREPARDLSVDQWINHQPALLCRAGQHRRRPVKPLGILGHDIQDHIAVDEGRHSRTVGVIAE